MTSRPMLPALLAISLVTGEAAAQQKRCITPPEAETLALVAMPAILVETRAACTTALPRSAFLRGGAEALIRKYQVESDRAWPAASKALARFVDPTFQPMLNTNFARPMLTALLLAQMVGRIDVKDCPTIDRMASLLQPLPPRNTAGLIVTTLQYLKAQKVKKGAPVKDVPDLPICDQPRP